MIDLLVRWIIGRGGVWWYHNVAWFSPRVQRRFNKSRNAVSNDDRNDDQYEEYYDEYYDG